MNPLKIVDHILLHLLHRKRSSNFQFHCGLDTPPPIDQLHVESFYPLPHMPDIRFEPKDQDGKYQLWRYEQDCQIQSLDSGNNTSYGLFYENQDGNEPNIHVIFVHGWRMNSLDLVHNLFRDRFLKQGWHLWYVTLPYHFERAPAASGYSGEFMVSANIDRTLLSVRQAITDLRALIHWIRKHRGGKIVLIGVSLGGFLTNLVGTLEKHLEALVSVFYANSLAYSVWHTVPGKYIKQDLQHHGFTYEQLQAYWAITDPSLFHPVVPLEHILLLSGIYDQYVVGEDTDRLWESWDKPRRILYPCGHAGLALHKNKIAQDVIQFLKPRLRG